MTTASDKADAKATAVAPAKLTPEQQARADQAAADKKVADDRAEALAKAQADLQADIAAAVAKHSAAVEPFVEKSLAEQAWNNTRADNPDFAHVSDEFRMTLVQVAKDYEERGIKSDIQSLEFFEIELERLVAAKKEAAKPKAAKPSVVAAKTDDKVH